MLICQLSPAVPLAVYTSLLTRWPAARLVMLNTGLVVSVKLAVKVRPGVIWKASVAPLVVWLPVQLANLKPLPGVAVML